jgi:hypothetical protein
MTVNVLRSTWRFAKTVVRTSPFSARVKGTRHLIDTGYTGRSPQHLSEKLLTEIHGLSIIREALGLSKYAVANECSGSKITQNVILDAEMVAFSSRLQKVDGVYSAVFHVAYGLSHIFLQNSGEYEV